MKKKQSGVLWYLPNKNKPFATSTKATSDLIAILYEESQDLSVVYEQINYDDEAKNIVKYYLDHGFRQVNIRY